ncbi:MAG: Rz1-like lysis system protein LysC [Shewanella sp.]
MSGCSSAPPAPAPHIIRLSCLTPPPCRLPQASPATNGDLLDQLAATEAAWAVCAAAVDAVATCLARQASTYYRSDDEQANANP